MSRAAAKQSDFDSQRPYLMGLAYRMLGSRADAEDAVQETWLRWQKQLVSPDNAKAWLTRVCANICIDALRKLKQERTHYVGPWLPEPVAPAPSEMGYPQVDSGALAESLQLAYMLLLEKLTPTERAALLLHDVFGYSFEDIAEILSIGTATVRQHASRARRHIASTKTRFDTTSDEIRQLGACLRSALADGDIDQAIRYLAADVELWSDGGGKAIAARNVLVGRDSVAAFLGGIFRKARPGSRLEEGWVNHKPAMLLFDQNSRLVAILSLSCDMQGGINRILAHRNPDKIAAMRDSLKII